MASIPAEIHGQRYLSLATFRKSGVAVYTPIWFAEDDNKLYFMTSSKTGKYKRIATTRKSRSLHAPSAEKSPAPNSPQPPASCRRKSLPASAG